MSDVAQDGTNYDFTIVGTGPAGITLALMLAKKGNSVLLLEGGGYQYTEKSQQIYDGKSIRVPYSLTGSRSRFFGGTSNLWSGLCRPLDEIDLEKFPINKDDLDPYLDEACSILEINSNFKDKLISKYLKQISFQLSPPVRFNRKYKNFIERSDLICLVLNANVLSIREGKSGSAVEYVEVVGDDDVQHKIKVNRLIVACGGIENSRLLLWSQYINKKIFTGLTIGRKWMEHPYAKTGEIIGDSQGINKSFDPSLVVHKKNWTTISPTKRMIKKHGIGNACIRISTEQPYRYDTKLKELIKDILCSSPGYGKKLANYAKKNLICGVSVNMVLEQKPHNDNRIEIDHYSKDRYGVPRVKLIFDFAKGVQETAYVSMKELGGFFLDKDIGRVGISPTLLGNEDSFGPSNHHMGGTNMSTSLKTGVVDSNLKVFGVKNLWIAGSSVFSTSGHANPTLSIVQFSLRLGNHLSSLKT